MIEIRFSLNGDDDADGKKGKSMEDASVKRLAIKLGYSYFKGKYEIKRYTYTKCRIVKF